MTGQSPRTRACPCDCGQQIPAGRVACPAGWGRLPQALRDAITRARQTCRRNPTDTAAAIAHRTVVRQALDWYTHHPAGYPRKPCESCRAPMIWAVTSKGERLCLDAEPVAINGGGGDVRLTDRGPGLPPLATVVRHQGQLFGAREIYRRHITTCPYGDRYRAAARRTRSRRAGS